jgi:hypothetical protein
VYFIFLIITPISDPSVKNIVMKLYSKYAKTYFNNRDARIEPVFLLLIKKVKIPINIEIFNNRSQIRVLTPKDKKTMINGKHVETIEAPYF